MEPSLSPTLWRTCRMLANTRRLQLVRAMLDRPPQTVSELSERCALPFTICCQYLRLIQARGLCRAARSGRWVYYSLGADPSVAFSADILDALSQELREGSSDTSIVAELTACTHPRRIEILSILQAQSPLSFDGLAARSGISRPALSRHLGKLVRRGVVSSCDGAISVQPPSTPLASVLLRASASQRTARG